MVKRLVTILALIGLVAACAKKNDDQGAVAAAPQANSPVPASNLPGPKVENSPVKDESAKVKAQSVGSQSTNQVGKAGPNSSQKSGQGFGGKNAELPPEAKYEYSGTANDNLNLVLTGFSSGGANGDAETEREMLLKAKQISNAKLSVDADGSVTVVLDVPETNVLVQDQVVSAGADLAHSAVEALGQTRAMVRDELEQLSGKPVMATPKQTVDSNQTIKNQKENLPKSQVASQDSGKIKQVSQKSTGTNSQVKGQSKQQHKDSKIKPQSVVKSQNVKQHQIILRGFSRTSSKDVMLSSVNALGRKFGAQGSLKCYDADGGCNTSVATISFGDLKKEQQVQIIFRNSSFNYSIRYPETQIRDTLYEKFVNLFRDSRYTEILKGSDSNLLKLRKMESFEVINGRSAIKVTLQTFENEILTFKFSGIKDDQQGGYNEAVDKNVSLEDGLRLAQGEAFSTQLSDSISEARLVGNSGRGEFKLSLKMKALASTNDDTIELTLIRLQSKIKY